MPTFDDAVIISACRIPVGKFQGSLSDFTAPQLGAMVVREAVKRAGVDPVQVDECLLVAFVELENISFFNREMNEGDRDVLFFSEAFQLLFQ